MASLGQCLIANELSPAAQELIQMRIDGKSWKEIADAKGLKSPGSARTLFTKETGLTDYKIKGNTLKALLDSGYDTTQSAAKIQKLVDMTEKSIEHSEETAPVFHVTSPAPKPSIPKSAFEPEKKSLANIKVGDEFTNGDKVFKKTGVKKTGMNGNTYYEVEFKYPGGKPGKSFFNEDLKFDVIDPGIPQKPSATDFHAKTPAVNPETTKTAIPNLKQDKSAGSLKVGDKFEYMGQEWEVTINNPGYDVMAKPVKKGYPEVFAQDQLVVVKVPAGQVDIAKGIKKGFPPDFEKGDIIEYLGKEYKITFKADKTVIGEPIDHSSFEIYLNNNIEVKSVVKAAPTSTQPAMFVANPSVHEITASVQADIISAMNSGKTYTQIKTLTGVDYADIDAVVWNHVLDKNSGNVVKAWMDKKTSQHGIKNMKKMLNELSSNTGKKIDEIVNIMNDLYGTKLEQHVVSNLINKDVQALSYPGAVDTYGYSAYAAPETFEQLPKIVGPGEYPIFGEDGAANWHRSLGSDMSADVKEAMQAYTGSGYHTINSTLRNPSPSQSDLIRKIDRGMRPIPKDVTLVRRLGFKGFNVKNADELEKMVGLAITDDGYMSTAVRDGVWHGEVEMEIHVPKGTKGRYVNPFSRNKGEMEVILGRGTEFMIESATVGRGMNGSRIRLVVRVISQMGVPV